VEPDLAAALEFAVETARAAGAVILQHDGLLPHAQRGKAPRMKGPRDPVTAADLAAERLIVERLRARFPGTGIVAEEETREPGGAGLTWYVDPLDGTVNFSQAHPFFAVSIALYRGEEPLVGVVHAPRLQETFAARAGGGATLNGQRLSGSEKVRLQDALLGTGFAYLRNELADDNVRHFADFVPIVRDLRRGGSAALDLAYVAAGRLDGYWELSIKPWDIGAGALLVREAGGRVTTPEGEADFLGKPGVLISNGLIHAQMLRVLREGDAAPRPESGL
jgi:myo-inositol-1(or 4)-monophosphatase